MPSVRTTVALEPIDFLRTFALQNLGQFDPTATLTDSCLSKTFAIANGLCRVVVEAVPGGVAVACDGPDADSVQTELAAAFAADDGYGAFAPHHSLVERLHRQQAGLRLFRVPWLFDIACSAVLQQRVRSTDAMKDWRHIAQKHGSRHHPSGTTAFPSAAALAALPAWELEALGIDAKRSRTLQALAREIKMHPLRSSMTLSQLRARLGRIAGLGPWTVETILGFGAADPDALPPGDLYLPHLVCFAFAGESPGSDPRMHELMEPFRGQRFRVARLLYGSGIPVPRTSVKRQAY